MLARKCPIRKHLALSGVRRDQLASLLVTGYREDLDHPPAVCGDAWRVRVDETLIKPVTMVPDGKLWMVYTVDR